MTRAIYEFQQTTEVAFTDVEVAVREGHAIRFEEPVLAEREAGSTEHVLEDGVRSEVVVGVDGGLPDDAAHVRVDGAALDAPNVQRG